MWINGQKIKVCKICGEQGHTAFQCHKKPLKSSKKSHRSEIIHEIDKIYSQLRRIEQKNQLGYNYCEVCGKRLRYEDSNIGHLSSRRYIGTRFSNENTLIICRKCNMPGNKQKEILQKMEDILRNKYGNKRFETAQECKNLKPTTLELENMLKFYKKSLSCLQF